MTASDDYMAEMMRRASAQSSNAYQANGYAGWAQAANPMDFTRVHIHPSLLRDGQTLHNREANYAPRYREFPVSDPANRFQLVRRALRLYEKGGNGVTLVPELKRLLVCWVLPTTHDGLYSWWRENVVEVSL